MKCLTIDDSRVARSVVKRALLQLGFEVLEAGSGKEALATIMESDQFDIVFLDWEMPEMSGPELLEMAQAHGIVLGSHVIMCTSRSSTEDVMRALKLGVAEYIMKPFTPEDVKQKLLLLGIELPQLNK